MKKTITRLRIMFRRTIREVRRVGKRCDELLMKHPVASGAMFALAIVACTFKLCVASVSNLHLVPVSFPIIVAYGVVFGAVVGVLAYCRQGWRGKHELRSRSVGVLQGAALLTAFAGVFMCWWYGGVDDICIACKIREIEEELDLRISSSKEMQKSENAYDVLSKLVGTEACPSNCYCDVYRRETGHGYEIDFYSPENLFLARYWDVDEGDAQSDGCTSGGCYMYHYPKPSWEEENMFTNRVEYARIVDDIIASNDVVSVRRGNVMIAIRKAATCRTYDSGTNDVYSSALVSVVRGYCCAKIYRMIETGKTTEAVYKLCQLVDIGKLIIKGRASIIEKYMAKAIIRNAQEIARLAIPFLSKEELWSVYWAFKLNCPMYGVDMDEYMVGGYLQNDMLKIEIAEELRRRFGVEWKDEIKYLHRRIMDASKDVCTAFKARCYREGIGVAANSKLADKMEAYAVRLTYEKMDVFLRNQELIPASDEDKKRGRKWSIKHYDDLCGTDAWGRQFKWEWSSKEGYVTVWSSGLDGKWVTDDDLVKTTYADTPETDEKKGK